MSFIQLSEVMKSFSEGSADRHVLDGLDLSVERGEFVVLMGRSGAGKSTLLNLMGGLDSAAAGRIRIGDFDIHEMDEEKADDEDVRDGIEEEARARGFL